MYSNYIHFQDPLLFENSQKMEFELKLQQTN